jgi:preprotein translocase subunit SecD
MIKDVRFIAILTLTVVALYLVVSPLYIKKVGAVVDFVDPESTCAVGIGSTVNQIEGTVIISSADFDSAVAGKKAGQSVTMIADNAPKRCAVLSDGYIGIRVSDVEIEALRFGIDIEGGARVLLQAKEQVTQEDIEKSIGILNNRINIYGLSDVKIAPLGDDIIQIEMGGATANEIQDFVTSQGKFEGKIEEVISVRNGTGNFIFNGNRSTLSTLGNGQISLMGSTYSPGEKFFLENVEFTYVNTTNSSATLIANIFTGEDIVAVFTDAQNSAIRQIQGGYEFYFTVQLSQEGAQKFAKVTKGQPTTLRGTESFIEPRIVLFLDGQRMSELNIASNLAGQTITTVSIEGSESTREGAVEERLRLETILRSGSLPVEFEIVKTDTVTQTAGRELLNSIIFIMIAVAVAVSAIVMIRYRDIKIALPMIALSLGEILLILGVAASQIYGVLIILFALAIGIIKKEVAGVIGWVTVLMMIVITATLVVGQWTLDIAALAGLIAVMGTSVGQMIIMTDQLLKSGEGSLRERHKTALKLIWSSAATVVFAMIPLYFIGVGTLKGFAVATIVGVMIGLLITRPAYMAVLERIKKLNVENQ